MILENHGVTIYLSNDSKTDLRNILNVVGEIGKQSIWTISNVECFGESADVLHQISDKKKKISGEEFYELVSSIYQIIDGDFVAYNSSENNYWLLIRSVRGDEFDIETKDKKLLKKLRESFKNIKDLVY